MKKFNLYEEITNRIIQKLENGVVPWRKPWHNGLPVSWERQIPYRGINLLLLEPGEYATFKTIKEHGGTVKKGEKAHMVIFWKWIEIEDGQDEEGNPIIKKIPFMRYYSVFEINTQCEGLKSKRKSFDHNPIEQAEKIVQGYKDCPEIQFRSGRAYYRFDTDTISIPPMKDFESVSEYYNTLFHEMIHSTGHESRLNREGITQPHFFGDEIYSKEELIAEIGASFLSAMAGLVNDTIDNSASYIQSWLKVLRDDKRFIVSAAQKAQRAADYILGRKYDDEGGEEN